MATGGTHHPKPINDFSYYMCPERRDLGFVLLIGRIYRRKHVLWRESMVLLVSFEMTMRLASITTKGVYFLWIIFGVYIAMDLYLRAG